MELNYIKTLLKQLIKEEINLVLNNLNEGRFEDVALKFPEFKDSILWFKENNLNSKYIEWLAKQFIVNGFSEQEIDKEDLLELLNNFDNLSEKNVVKNKDINSYKSLYDLRNLVEFSQDQLKSKELNKKKEKKYETIYSDGDWLVTQPNSMEASCKLGSNTKWCISATKGNNAFDNYSSIGTRFIFVFNKQNNKKYAISYVPDSNEIEIFDEQDAKYERYMLGNLLPENIIKIINSKIGFEAVGVTLSIFDIDGNKIYSSETANNIKEAIIEAIENNVELKAANLQGANLQKVYLRGANLEGANLEGANLEDANLIGANLQGANLYRAKLARANLYRARLEGANVQKVYLRAATLQAATLQGANLQGANLQGADLSRANLTGANLEGTNLEGASLEKAELQGANLQRANLQYLNFSMANLQGANLTGANIAGANITGVNLEGANLAGANLEGAIISKNQIKIIEPFKDSISSYDRIYWV